MTSPLARKQPLLSPSGLSHPSDWRMVKSKRELREEAEALASRLGGATGGSEEKSDEATPVLPKPDMADKKKQMSEAQHRKKNAKRAVQWKEKEQARRSSGGPAPDDEAPKGEAESGPSLEHSSPSKSVSKGKTTGDKTDPAGKTVTKTPVSKGKTSTGVGSTK